MRSITTILIGILVTSLAAATNVELPPRYPSEPDEAVAIYEFAKEATNPVVVTGANGRLSPTRYLGRAVELHAKFGGRIAINAQDSGARRLLIRLCWANEQTIYAQSTSEVTGLQQDERVRAILDVPADSAHEAKFRLRAIVREYDLPRPLGMPAPSAAATPTPGPGISPLSVPPAPVTPVGGAATNAALPPEYRQPGSAISGLAPFPQPVTGVPATGKDGAWDAVGQAFPVVDQRTLSIWIDWVMKQNRRRTQREADWIVRWVIYYSALNGVDHRLMFAMIKCESNCNPFAVSRAGAVGLTQLMPCNVKDFKVLNKWNVQEQIRAGVEHFKQMLDLWKDRPSYEQFALGAASYNAGPNRVKRAGGRIPDIRETKNYVKKLGDLFYSLWKEGYP